MSRFSNTPLGGIPEFAASVSPDDETDLSYNGTLYIGSAGTLKVTTTGGSTVTYSNILAGSFLPVAVKRVWDTGTSASNIIVHYNK